MGTAQFFNSLTLPLSLQFADIEKEKQWGTKSEPRVVAKSMFGSLSRLAGDAFKGAKQVTHHGASISDLTMTNKVASICMCF